MTFDIYFIKIFIFLLFVLFFCENLPPRKNAWLILNLFNFFFKSIYFLLKDNSFTEFCCFLSNFNMNQPQIYIYPLPSETPSHPSRLMQSPCLSFLKYTAVYFKYGNVSFHVTLSIHLTLSSPLPISISLFSMSVYPLLPCKQILQYCFSRFCIYLLEYSVYLSLYDSLHSV